MSLESGFRNLYERVAEVPAPEAAARLALMVMLLSSWVTTDDWAFKVPLRVLAIAGLLVPPWHMSRALWAGVATLMVARTLDNWWVQDNHIFLFTWWTIAMWAALSVRDSPDVLARSSRLLLGLCFFFATLWKGFLSPDFMSGDYFHYTFLTDVRFEEAARLLGGLDRAAFEHNRKAIGTLADGTATVDTLKLHGTAQLALLTQAVTWWTAFIEGALAVTFLAPVASRLGRARHATLFAFAWTTYMVARVETFGWTLLVIGLAQCEPDRRLTKVLYVASVLLVMIYDYVPIVGYLRRFFVG